MCSGACSGMPSAAEKHAACLAAGGSPELCKLASEADLSTRAGREAAARAAAYTAAESGCASLGVPPTGLCGKAAMPFADAAIDAWNGVFGNDDAERALERRRNVAQFFTQFEHALLADLVVERSVRAAAARLILISRKEGWPSLGGGASGTDASVGMLGVDVPGPFPWFAADQAARKLLLDAGLPMTFAPSDTPTHSKGLAYATSFVATLRDIDSKSGLVAAAAWMRSTGQSGYKQALERIAMAEAFAVGLLAARAVVREHESTALFWWLAAGAAAGAALWRWRRGKR